MVDTDGDLGRKGELVDERERLRPTSVPIAVGAAHPHGEAWLVDDLVPLRTVLGLPATASAPPGRHPKDELQELLDADGRDFREVFALLAVAIDPSRCRRARQTGLADFLDDVRRELARLRTSG